MKRLISLLMLVVISGCSKRNISSKHIQEFKKSLVSEEEAKLFDVSITLDAVPIKDLISNNSYAYKSNMSMEDLSEYLEEDMELFGWKLVTRFEGKESLMVFEKPLKYSTISIRPSGKSNLILIFITNK